MTIFPQMYCQQISQEESIDELYMKGTEAVGNILAITAGAVGVAEFGPELYKYLKTYLNSSKYMVSETTTGVAGSGNTEAITALKYIFKKYGLSETSSIEEIKEAIRASSYTKGQTISQVDLLASLTGVNSVDEAALLDYLVVDTHAISTIHNVPNPAVYGDVGIDAFVSALIEQNKGVNYVQGSQAILSYDSFVANYYKNNPGAGGFFINAPKYANDVFLANGDPGTLAHELLHLNQYAAGSGGLNATSEYQAYLYQIMTDYANNKGVGDVAAELIRGITASTGKTVEQLLGLN